jgi:hypothetical protein
LILTHRGFIDFYPAGDKYRSLPSYRGLITFAMLEAWAAWLMPN